MPANKPFESANRSSSRVPPSAGVTMATESAVATPDNQLLAGYLAHEFLTRGTLFGTRFRNLGGDDARPAKRPRVEIREKRSPAPAKEKADGDKDRVYVEVARLLREDGLHLPGIVNPLQLAVHLQIV